MDYTSQQRYLTRSNVWSWGWIALILLAAAWPALNWQLTARPTGYFAYGATITACVVSLYYNPNYLQLSANRDKPFRWTIKIRWRIAAAVLVLGTLLQPNLYGILNLDGVFIAFCAASWVALANLAASRLLPSRFYSAYFFITDFLLLVALLAFATDDLLLVAAAFSCVAHLAILISQKRQWLWSSVFTIIAVLLTPSLVSQIVFKPGAQIRQPPFYRRDFEANDGRRLLPVLLSLATAVLVWRARRHSERTGTEALNELQAFTGYAATRIRELWSTADQQLAANWKASGVGDKSPEEIAAWYRANSELYMFAISAYNLEYKRIKSNLKMLQYASGACLDYGAGNGELILELARRGHRAAYYDVDGVSKRFAEFRAAKYGLNIDFASTKDELRAIAARAPFDTIFSFDVLEHIPDLGGELDFLISLLAPSGLLLFDVPAGATLNHPMHLNHTLNVREHLLARGLKEVPMRSFNKFWRIGKQGKYAFRRPATTNSA